MHRKFFRLAVALLIAVLLSFAGPMVRAGVGRQPSRKFHLQEPTIEHIQQSLLSRQITTTGLVELYLKRIKAYNGVCVNEPQGILGPITTIPHAGHINALPPPNLRP